MFATQRSTLATPRLDTAHSSSADADHRRLLAESIAPSESASQRSSGGADGDVTPRAHSPARTLTDDNRQSNSSTVQPYKGFASEAEYLAALHAWAETKKYVQPDSGLVGFYGRTTVEELANRPRTEFGLRKLLKERKARKELKRQPAS